jgi:hypothetical protein
MLFQTPIFTSASFSGSITGDGSGLTGVVSSSYALTASYAENAGGGAGFPFVGQADITGSLTVVGAITGSVAGNIIPFYFANQSDFPSAASFHGAVAHSHADAAMYYAHGGVWLKLKNDDGIYSGSFEGDGSQLTGLTTDVVETTTVVDTFTNAPSHSVAHNFGTKNVIISVYEGDTVFIPNSIVTTDNNTVDIVFGSNITGRVVVAKGGHFVSGSLFEHTTVVDNFSVTGSHTVTHAFNTKNVIVQVYDNNDNVISPSNIKTVDVNTVKVSFSTSETGRVVVAKGGHKVTGIQLATSASYATTASYIQASGVDGTVANATTASFASTISNTITGSITTQVDNQNASSGSISFWQGSQTEYDAISSSADPNTVYFVT